jgi:hypothetical protein
MIPREHHPYYHGLKSEETVRDALPEPNYDESEEDSTDLSKILKYMLRDFYCLFHLSCVRKFVTFICSQQN